ncbi:MAG: hypothetical protein JWL93_1867 [Hyphomicrobiales bacterium]|jgi:hypothetical protein|nr:hypothetical protein [Hyphomicrobiales bacterium]
MKPAVILVGADKGGVGKTTVSRALLDYLAANDIPARAFDTESPRGTLQRFHPAVTKIVDVTQTTDQMRIFDTLSDTKASVTVIDVRAGQLSNTLKALKDVGFLDAVNEGDFTFVLFHVLGPSVSSLGEIAEIAPFVTDAHYFLVKNFINDTTFFEWDPKTYSSYFGKVKSSGDVTVPKLDALACEKVEVAGVPFASFVAGKTGRGDEAQNSFVLRGYVRTWLRNVSAEFDRVGLRALLLPKPRRR